VTLILEDYAFLIVEKVTARLRSRERQREAERRRARVFSRREEAESTCNFERRPRTIGIQLCKTRG